MATREMSLRTTDHEEIRQWAQERAGRPALIDTDGNGGGVLRIDFGEPDETLEQISWDQFFRIFDENQLAFMYQEETDDGRRSYFNKFVPRSSDSEASIADEEVYDTDEG